MWIVFGIVSIVTGLLNVVLYVRKKAVIWLSFVSLSTTSLVLCDFYTADAKWVMNEDWGALSDVTPSVYRVLWFCTIASILINSIPLWKRKER
ncbi:hypothetical protein [Amedibacillus sp. YH-ame10]